MYYVIVTYPGSGAQSLMISAEKRAVASTAENLYLLKHIAKELLKDNLIASYQVVMTIEPETNAFTSMIDHDL